MMLNELDIWMPKLAMDLDLIMLQTWANSQSSPRHDSLLENFHLGSLWLTR